MGCRLNSRLATISETRKTGNSIMKSNETAPSSFPRRKFLKDSFKASVAAPIVLGLEERLLAQAAPVQPVEVPSFCKLWQGRIGKVKISRLICGGNLISGYAHSRDLIYVSDLLLHY